MPKIKKKTKSSNVLKFSFTETLSGWVGGGRVFEFDCEGERGWALIDFFCL